MMKKHVTACLTAAVVLAAPVAVSGTLTAGAIAQEAPAPAPAADQKPDVLGRPTVSEKQVSDEEGYFDSAHGEGVKIYYRKQKVANPRGAVVWRTVYLSTRGDTIMSPSACWMRATTSTA